MGLTIAGIVHAVATGTLIGAGAAINHKASVEGRDESVSLILYGAGALTGIVGVPLLAAGIPLWVTGQVQLDRYEAKHPDVTIEMGPGTVGVTLRVP